MEIIFVTSNFGKFLTLQGQLENLGISVVQRELEIVEPQAEQIETITMAKASHAFSEICAPLVVEDSGFYVKCLKGFPGPYVKYVLDTIGIEGLLRLTSGQENADCEFHNVLVYCDSSGKNHVFKDSGIHGKLSREVDHTPCEEAWSSLWKIFIPYGQTKTLSAMSEKERLVGFQRWNKKSVFLQFREWLESRSNRS